MTIVVDHNIIICDARCGSCTGVRAIHVKSDIFIFFWETIWKPRIENWIA
jgi:hypothetical protein